MARQAPGKHLWGFFYADQNGGAVAASSRRCEPAAATIPSTQQAQNGGAVAVEGLRQQGIVIATQQPLN